MLPVSHVIGSNVVFDITNNTLVLQMSLCANILKVTQHLHPYITRFNLQLLHRLNMNKLYKCTGMCEFLKH